MCMLATYPANWICKPAPPTTLCRDTMLHVHDAETGEAIQTSQEVNYVYKEEPAKPLLILRAMRTETSSWSLTVTHVFGGLHRTRPVPLTTRFQPSLAPNLEESGCLTVEAHCPAVSFSAFPEPDCRQN